MRSSLIACVVALSLTACAHSTPSVWWSLRHRSRQHHGGARPAPHHDGLFPEVVATLARDSLAPIWIAP